MDMFKTKRSQCLVFCAFPQGPVIFSCNKSRRFRLYEAIFHLYLISFHIIQSAKINANFNFVVDLKDSDKLSSLLTLKGKFYTLAIANNPLMILVEILLWQDQNKKYGSYSATKVTKF